MLVGDYRHKKNATSSVSTFTSIAVSYIYRKAKECMRKPTNQNKPRGLEQPLVVPVRVDLLEYVTHPVVFSEPDGGVHHQPGDQTECFVSYCESLRLVDVRRVVHLDTDVFYSWGIHFSVQHL